MFSHHVLSDASAGPSDNTADKIAVGLYLCS